MAISNDLLKALLLLVRYCATQQNCATCPIKDFCDKQIQEW